MTCCPRCGTPLPTRLGVCTYCYAPAYSISAPPADPWAKTPEFAVTEIQVPGAVTRGPRAVGPLAAGLSGFPQAPSRPRERHPAESDPLPFADDAPAVPADGAPFTTGPRVVSLVDHHASIEELVGYGPQLS